MKLTLESIRNAQPGDELKDAVLPGLHLRVFPRRKSFYFRYRTRGGRPRRPKLGDWPTMKLEDARDVARELLKRVAIGEDPKADWLQAKGEPTVAKLCERYLEKYAPMKKSGAQDAASIRLYIEPRAFYRLTVAEVTHDDVDGLHAKLKAKPIAANRTLALLSVMFNLAEKWGWRQQGTNPCRHVRRFPETKRRRYMTSDEAAKVSAGLRARWDTEPQSVLFIYLLILSGARKGEIAAAKWDWLKDGVLYLPDSKTGAKPVYLPKPALDLLKRIPRTTGTLTGIKDPKKLWDAVRREAGCPDLRMHDLRHSFASVALAAGYTLDQIGELLGHASSSTTKRYAHLIDEMARSTAEGVGSAVAERLGIAERTRQNESP